MSGDRAFDCKFVRKILLMLYDGQTDKLSHRCVRGTKERVVKSRHGTKIHPAKLPITPMKFNAIRSAYNQRIEKHCPDSLDFTKRISDAHFNKILNAVLSNLKFEPKKSVLDDNNEFEILELEEKEVEQPE